MSQLPPRVERINALLQRRAEVAAELAEIDRLLDKAADAIGDATGHTDSQKPTPAAPTVNLPRLPVEARMGAHMSMYKGLMQILLHADHGYTRMELREELMKTPRFREMLIKNMNSYYNNLQRGLKRPDAVVERNGLLYHAARAPLEDQEAEQPSRLPSNVTLLSKMKEGGEG